MTGVDELTIVSASPKRPCAPMISATPRPVTNKLRTAAVTEPSNNIDASASTPITIGESRSMSCRLDSDAAIST